MITRSVTIENSVGLHARPATFFIQKANSYKCSIWVEKEDCRVNAKSLLGVLSLGVSKGTTITLIADGSDESEAIAEALAAFRVQKQRALARLSSFVDSADRLLPGVIVFASLHVIRGDRGMVQKKCHRVRWE